MIWVDWLALAVGIGLLTWANVEFYFARRRVSYLLFLAATAVFAAGFIYAALIRGEYTAGLTQMIVYLSVYAVERLGFILFWRWRASRRPAPEEEKSTEKQDKHE